MSEHTLYLHETPIIRAFFKRLRCIRKGGHRHIYTGRTCLDDDSYLLHYVCLHCQHVQYREASI